ncbi:MAG: hypothetical protein RL367_2226 [Pseudomonadota bacterium]
MTDAITGSCLCGEVAFEIIGKIGPIGQCHCSKCRKASGTDGNAVCYTAFASLRWVRGEEYLVKWRSPGDQPWSTAFCKSCGSPMPNANKDKKIYFVPAGSLDDDPGHKGYAAHIFVGSKAPWVCIADTAPQFVEGFNSARVDP